MTLAEFAAKLRAAADRAETELAGQMVTAMERDYLAVLRIMTPKLTGALADSEYPDFIRVSGTHAEAVVGPHIVYARFRNDGGTITSKGPWPLRNKATGQVFGRSVTQAGSHYMERAHDAAQGACHVAAQAAVDRFFAESGL